MRELKGVIEQLEGKIGDKEKGIEGEKADKNKFKNKYEEAMDKVAKLEA